MSGQRRSRGYARVPRELFDGLPWAPVAIVTHVLLAGADRSRGYRTTHSSIAEVLELGDRTVQRWMPRLRELRILDYPSVKTRTHLVRMGSLYWELLGEAEPLAVPEAEPLAEPLAVDAEDVAVDDPAPTKGLRLIRGEDVAEPTETEDQDREKHEAGPGIGTSTQPPNCLPRPMTA